MNHHPTATAFAIEQIKRLIIERRLRPGIKIDQAEVAEMLGLSRIPVRQALAHLAERNFVEWRDRRGAVVAPISRNDMQELYALRCHLERWAFEQYFDGLEGPLRERLEEINDRTERVIQDDELSAFMTINREFHDTLYETVQNRHLLAVLKRLFDLSERYHWACHIGREMMLVSLREHRQLVEFIRQGDLTQFLDLCTRHNEKTAQRVLQMEDASGDINIGAVPGTDANQEE
jgi:DNA-binding GntR family transcriptional regulator